MGIDSQVCFHRGLFSSLSNRERAPQGLWSHWMALIRMCVVPNCSQPLSRPILWIVAVCATYWTHSTAVCLLMVGSRPILWIVAVCATYWTHSTAVCLLMVGLTRLQLPTHPRHPPPSSHSPTPLYTPSVILQSL